MNKRIPAIVVVLLVFLISSSLKAQTGEAVKKAIIKVGNIHCDNDMPTIKKYLLNKDGIYDVTYTDRVHSASMFTITFQSDVVNQMQIEEAIEATPGCDDPDDRPYRVRKIRSPKKRKS